jgi:hypothetical protein
VVRHLPLVAALAAGGAAWAGTDLPEAVAAFTQENLDACRGAGGTPSLQGLGFPGAGQTAEVHAPYATTAELNGDGVPDYVTDLAGLECANAWSYFCGSAGCPVTVWLSGPGGHSVGWGGSAQTWRLDGAEVVLSLHGQLCTPPRMGAEGCEVAMNFAGQAGAAPAPAAPQPAELAPGRSPRPKGKPEEAAGTAPFATPPAVPTPEPPPVAGWSSGEMPDGSGWFAGVVDAAAGRRVDWLCAKGRRSLFALSPYAGGPRIAIDVDGRVQEFDVEVLDGAAYAPVEIAAPLFLHIVSGPAFTVSEPGGAPLGTFPMEGAPRAIGQAEGRCQFEALRAP